MRGLRRSSLLSPYGFAAEMPLTPTREGTFLGNKGPSNSFVTCNHPSSHSINIRGVRMCVGPCTPGI